jgi:hypothetical protein
LNQDVNLKEVDFLKPHDYCFTHTLDSTDLFSNYLNFSLTIDENNDEQRLNYFKMIADNSLFNGSGSSVTTLSKVGGFSDRAVDNFDQVIRMIYATDYTSNHEAFEIFSPLTVAEYVDNPVITVSTDLIADSTNVDAVNSAESFYQTLVNYFASLSGNPGNQLTSAELSAGSYVDLDDAGREVNEICFYIKLLGNVMSNDLSSTYHSLDSASSTVIKVNLVKSGGLLP